MTYPSNRFCWVVWFYGWTEIDKKYYNGKSEWSHGPFTEKNAKIISKWPTNQDGGPWPLYFAKSLILHLRIASDGPNSVHGRIFIWLDYCTMYLCCRNSKWPTFQDGGFQIIPNLKTGSECSYVTEMILLGLERFLRRPCIWYYSIITIWVNIQDGRLWWPNFMFWCV